MQMRMRLKKERTNRPAGTLTCSKCKMPHQYALWEGDLCKRCFKPKSINPKYIANIHPRKIDPRIQTPSTLALQARCLEIMKEHNLRKFRFARKIGVTPSLFDIWISGQMGEKGQRNMLARVAAGIDAWKKEIEA